MKLIIRRDQAAKKGLFGGHKGMTFSLYCKVLLTEDEHALINKYIVDDYVLTWRDGDNGQYPGVTVRGLVNGHMYDGISDVSILLNNESVIKNACRSFKNLLLVMASFGGEEIIDIDKEDTEE